MTERPTPAPTATPTLMRAKYQCTRSPNKEQPGPDTANRMRRTGSPARSSGRYAVGLRPSLDPDPLIGAPSIEIGARKKTGRRS